MERPMTSWPCSFRSRAATEESTPPDIATATRIIRASSFSSRRRHDEHQRRAPDGELGLVLEAHLVDLLLADVGSVGRAEVDEHDLLARDLDGRVRAGDLRVVHVQVRALAPDDDPRLLDRKDLSGVG